MAATGAFSTILNRTLQRPNVIYRAPSTSPVTTGSIPTSRLPATQMPTTPTRPTAPTQVFPVNVDPTGNSPQPVSPSGPGGFVPSGPSQPGPTAQPPITTGTTPGGDPQTGGGTGGGSDTSRLLDMLANAFQPQQLQQGYAPQSVSTDAGGAPSSGPALAILALVAVVGIIWYTNRNKRRAA